MATLNYHHLRYFWEVAREGNLSRAAERLNISQSALSIQIKQLEERLDHPLFDRVGRNLILTEVGRIALDHADRIFSTGDELMAVLAQSGSSSPPLRVGALSTLSRNFQIRFLRPILKEGEVDIQLKSGSMTVLLEALRTLALDVVLTTELPAGELSAGFAAQKIAENTVELHGVPARIDHPSLESLLRHEPLILTTDSAIRAGFEALISRLNINPRIIADVDDMAMVRLLAREGVGVAIAPRVVVADEINSGMLQTAPFDLEIAEVFYAVTVKRSYPHPLLAGLLAEGSGSNTITNSASYAT